MNELKSKKFIFSLAALVAVTMLASIKVLSGEQFMVALPTLAGMYAVANIAGKKKGSE